MTRSASYAIQSRFMALYLHDDFKITPRFTMNLGLRYEKESPITERYDRSSGGRLCFRHAEPCGCASAQTMR